MNNVIDFYNQYDEDLRFLRNSRNIEFLTSTHVLDGIIPANSNILDVGAGTGIYSFYYAEKGHNVVSIDITPKHVEIINKKSNEKGINLKAYVDNATDLCRFESESFDFVMCFGPMYHLIHSDDRDKCIRECLRVLKNSGILAVAYISKFSIMPMLVTRDASFISDSMISKVIDEGCIQLNDDDCFWTDAYFFSSDEIENFMSQYQVSGIDHVATDGLSHIISDDVDKLSDNQFTIWLNYHLKTCREKSILGCSSHGLYICRKNSY